MAWRKWLVRGLVLGVLGAVAAAAFLYERWTNPAAVRQQVLAQMVRHFPGARVTLESAYLRLLGGIAFKDLRLARADDPDQAEFAYFPSGIVYHDKEALVQGRLAVRKVELPHPRLRVRRDRAGHWNLQGITGPLSDEQIPTIVVQDGTLLFMDDAARPGSVLLEVSNVQLTILNDPLASVRLQGTGRSDLTGPLTIRGTWDRTRDEVDLSLDVMGMRIDPALLERVQGYAPQLAGHLEHLEGTCALHAELGYHPGAAQPWTHDVRCELTGGHFSHPELPLPLDNLTAVVRCLDGDITVERLTARVESADLRLTRGRVFSLGPDPDMEGTLEVSRLPLTSKLFAGRLPANLRRIQRDYAPTGAVNLKLVFAHRQGHWIKHCWIHPKDMTICFRRFPYPLTHIGGQLEQELDPTKNLDVLHVDLVGFTGKERVYIRGTLSGTEPSMAVDLHVWGNNVPLDSRLRNALPVVHQKLADEFHPIGLCDIDVHIARAAGVPDYRQYIIAKFHDAAIRYAIFPYPLEHVRGTLEIRPEGWRFYDFLGTHRGLTVTCSGGSRPTPHGDGLTVSIRGTDLLLDPELEKALDPELKPTWQMLAPSGRMHFRAEVSREPNQDPDLDVTVTPARCAIKPSFFPYTLDTMTGTAHFTKRRRTVMTKNGLTNLTVRTLTLDNLVAHHGATLVKVDHGDVELDPRGNGVYIKLAYLHGTPLVPDADFVRALPDKLKQVITGIHLHDPISLHTTLVVRTYASEENPPEIFWDGQLDLKDVNLSAGVTFEHVTGAAGCRGKVIGPTLQGLVGNLMFKRFDAYQQPFHDVHASLLVRPQTPEVLELPELTGHLFGGDVGGQARLEFESEPRFEVNLTAARIGLEEFGRHNLAAGTLLSGQAMARLNLTGKGENVRDLSGAGSLDIGPKSQLYNLPLLLDLLKVLGLRKPDGTAFEEAHADFSIRGPRVVVSQVDLFGNSFSLRGQGEMGLDGSDVDFSFYAVWAQAVQMLPPVIKEIPQAISKQLLKIRMRGSVGNVQCTKEPVPALVEPLQAFLERVAGWQRETRSLKTTSDHPDDPLPRVELPPRPMGR